MTRKDLQTVVDLTAEQFNHEPMPIHIKQVRGGGRANRKYITLPAWLEKYAEAYQVYYAVHEICHYIAGWSTGHCPRFKRIENEALLLWDIKIKRARAYPREMTMNGQKIKNIVK